MSSSPSLNFPSCWFLSVLHAQSKNKRLRYSAYSLANILEMKATEGTIRELFNDKNIGP